MKGLMMHRPLKIADIITFAAETYPNGEIVSVRTEGDIHRTTYLETSRRIAQLAHGLKELGVKPGDRVATLAWNGYRHFELYYAISGIGAICHTINPRLSPVRTGCRLRGRFVLESVEQAKEKEADITWQVTVEIEGAKRPALTAAWLNRFYLE